MDVFLYNGEMRRGSDLKFINTVAEGKDANTALIILVTPGGSPDAAFKMARYLQRRYDSYSVLVSGLCKSAGTLFAIGANELVFAPYGELGPLDVQLQKTDQIAAMESGLNISEAFQTLEERARETFLNVTISMIASSGGVVSFQTAAHAAAELVGSLYGPVFGRIDPEEVGSRSRSMRIGEDYGERLNTKWNNLKPGALGLLSRDYSSHGFVIDSLEASLLFERVRMASDEEMEIVMGLGSVARQPSSELTVKKLLTMAIANGDDDDTKTEVDRPEAASGDGDDSGEAGEAERATAGGQEGESDGGEAASQ